ncbi:MULTISPECIES: V-type ATP synthase subunit I [environmental samples]|uniref:V-type ATP synthase subunit I n=1 Tax=environmental samples TaxID=876090 RepID=UPI0003362288|nr:MULTISPECIES: V-type ATP synthase subunit I [environmental samples]CDC71239.1 v-type Na(+)-transporting ATPase I subunit [Oscillibacter sp. CAG:155]
MAIVKMKKLRVMAMADRREALLRALLRLGCVEISEPDGLLEDPAWSALLQRGSSRLADTKSEINDVNTALDAIRRYAGLKDGLFIKRHPISEEAFLSAGTAERAQAVSREVGEQLQTLTRLQSEENRLVARQASLLPWQAMDMPLELSGTEHVLFRPGVVPAGVNVGELQVSFGDLAAELLEISSDKQQKYCLLVCLRQDEEAVMECLRPFSFSAVSFQGLTGTADANLTSVSQALAENRKAQEDAAAAIAANGEARDALRVYADRLAAEAAEETSAQRILTDGTIAFFEGWAPAASMQKVQALLEKEGCAWEAEDPTPEEYSEVPIQLKNNWLTRPLNMVTEMYSLPAYDNVDPNPLMAPFFILFYGVMMADMGYGLLMILAGILITRTYRPKGTAGNLFNLMTLCGVTTFLMGAVTGGFFGDFLTQLVKLATGRDFALPALFTPLDDTLMILVGAMCLGFVQIVTGMVISFVQKLKKGQVLDAVFEEVTWWVVFAGIALMVLKVTNLVLYAGLVLVVAGPLITGKGFGKITGIFASLYNHITGYFGDILSYSRLMALMLAGSVIAQVFNTLGAIPGNIVVFIIISMAGNALNFALNLLGCYVHDLRLQCLEYFGKFYEDGGKPFRPLAINTKYVDIENV